MRRIAVSLALAGLTGCGTAHNFYPQDGGERPLKVYGGVKKATDDLKEATGDGVAAALLCVLWPLPVANVALSAIGDTVTLPVTVWAEAGRAISEPVKYHAAPANPPPGDDHGPGSPGR